MGYFLAAREEVIKGTKRGRQRNFNLKSLVPRAEFDKTEVFLVSIPVYLLRKPWGDFYSEVMKMVFRPIFSNLIFLLILCKSTCFDYLKISGLSTGLTKQPSQYLLLLCSGFVRVLESG